jgi:hypothetical protein
MVLRHKDLVANTTRTTHTDLNMALLQKGSNGAVGNGAGIYAYHHNTYVA